jgi:predicted nucleic acid-binding protein
MLFLDTNVLLYAVSPAPDEAAKRRIAEEIVLGGEWAFSPQVMSEFYVNAIKPTPSGPGLTASSASEYLSLLLPDHPCQAMDAELVLTAQSLHQRFRVQWWDALILATAARMGCRYLLSEDLSHGQDYDGVTVLNPFVAESTGISA